MLSQLKFASRNTACRLPLPPEPEVPVVPETGSILISTVTLKYWASFKGAGRVTPGSISVVVVPSKSTLRQPPPPLPSVASQEYVPPPPREPQPCTSLSNV